MSMCLKSKEVKMYEKETAAGALICSGSSFFDVHCLSRLNQTHQNMRHGFLLQYQV